MPFHKGFYTVEMTFYFEISIDTYSAPNVRPETVSGLGIYIKKAVLYGGEGSIKVFTSDIDQFIPNNIHHSLPKAVVMAAEPIPLDAKLLKGKSTVVPCCQIPDPICKRFGGSFFMGERIGTVTVTLGLFTIVHMERYSQITVPSCEYIIPEQDCPHGCDSPCEMFRKLDFPSEAFFPQKFGE